MPTFVVAAVALAALARLVGTATEQLGARLGSGGASVVQSALGNLPELFIALFALHDGLVERRPGGARRLDPREQRARARPRVRRRRAAERPADASTPSRARIDLDAGGARGGDDGDPVARPRVPRTGRGAREALSLVCAGVLLTLFVLTLPSFLRSAPGEEHEPARWSTPLTAVVLGVAGAAAAFTSDWFVTALTPAIHTLHMSEEFAGLVIVAIAGNAVENVVGVQLAARNKPDFADLGDRQLVAADRTRADAGARDRRRCSSRRT